MLSEDEPEWFSGGPTSQSDTIELRGFEDPAGGDMDRSSSQGGRKKQSPSRKKRNRERAITKTNDNSSTSKEESPKGKYTTERHIYHLFQTKG